MGGGVSVRGPKRVALPSHGNCPEIIAYVPGDDQGHIFLELKAWREALFPRSRCPDYQSVNFTLEFFFDVTKSCTR